MVGNSSDIVLRRSVKSVQHVKHVHLKGLRYEAGNTRFARTKRLYRIGMILRWGYCVHISFQQFIEGTIFSLRSTTSKQTDTRPWKAEEYVNRLNLVRTSQQLFACVHWCLPAGIRRQVPASSSCHGGPRGLYLPRSKPISESQSKYNLLHYVFYEKCQKNMMIMIDVFVKISLWQEILVTFKLKSGRILEYT